MERLFLSGHRKLPSDSRNSSAPHILGRLKVSFSWGAGGLPLGLGLEVCGAFIQ
jgi:hypothetical protein